MLPHVLVFPTSYNLFYFRWFWSVYNDPRALGSGKMWNFLKTVQDMPFCSYPILYTITSISVFPMTDNIALLTTNI